jgi:hypothetical protein
MKKLLLILLAATAILSMAVSCQKSDNRDELYPMQVMGPKGTLDINSKNLYIKEGLATLVATYRNAEGLYEPRAIKLTPDVVAKIDGDHAIFEIRTPGSYTVSAGDLSISIKVMNGD